MPLVGREGELRALREMIEALAAGSGGCAVVTGAAGIGKTSLLREAVPARDERLTIAAGGATEVDWATPMRTLLSVLHGCPELRDGLDRIGPYQGDRAYVERLGELLAECAVGRPVLIAIDDVQWIDEASAVSVRTLVAELSSSPVLWLFAHRVTDNPPFEAGGSGTGRRT
jgi:predicted ATPase